MGFIPLCFLWLIPTGDEVRAAQVLLKKEGDVQLAEEENAEEMLMLELGKKESQVNEPLIC